MQGEAAMRARPRFHGNLFPGAQASQEAACQGSVWPASLLIQA